MMYLIRESNQNDKNLINDFNKELENQGFNIRLPITHSENLNINNASGGVDGFTHLIWGTNTRKDILQLKPQTEDYIKPEAGVMLIFPNWLKHQVLPFFGEGERRSMAFNWNVNDSEREMKKYMSDNEKEKYDQRKKDSVQV